MDNTVKELLAAIGERVVRGKVPSVIRGVDKVIEQLTFTIPDEPRKLVIDPDGTIGWFNSEGPEE